MIIIAAPAVVGAAFNKMQVAWLPDAHPWLITGVLLIDCLILLMCSRYTGAGVAVRQK